MASLWRHYQKQWQNSDLPETRQIILIWKVLIRAIQKSTFIEFEPLCLKSYGHLCQILACFIMTTHQIRSSHATQGANFEIFNFNLICIKS